MQLINHSQTITAIWLKHFWKWGYVGVITIQNDTEYDAHEFKHEGKNSRLGVENALVFMV